MASTSIGVFDSGFGGLTVLKALLEVIPGANYLYFGDTARLPYGSKSAETVAKYAVEAARFLNQQVARVYLREAFADGFESADVLVLGCTHYPLIKPLLRRLAPPHVSVVDSAESTAQVVKGLRPQSSSQSEEHGSPSLKFFATDSVEKFQRLGERFLDRPIKDVEHVDLRE